VSARAVAITRRIIHQADLMRRAGWLPMAAVLVCALGQLRNPNAASLC
jgi:hypothetical protein